MKSKYITKKPSKSPFGRLLTLYTEVYQRQEASIAPEVIVGVTARWDARVSGTYIAMISGDKALSTTSAVGRCSEKCPRHPQAE